ncbi:hypothetical protein EDB81DRAFT_885007 [Dactylonectria macrodidyma]|uniref:Prolyl 4-hydroxylase alpha subunit Fe(2+) 2OG dioxygenase domain-containing protein n=1 Tax=Dactylonectria macrodidyma TaxID=307937 RepID=A0A9P9J5J2_9HYPO|nr:hypothetical protein EDB81DRAFT_885007 [Dactylonectria macrodidyma]
MASISTATRAAVAKLEHDHVQNQTIDSREDLLNALQGIETSGSFASFRALSKTPPAGLSVYGVGDIEMPLSEAQARQMIASARQAPYGKGSETLVDTSVRNTWELDASQFTFNNPSWPAYIQKLCAFVSQDLGINATIRAEVYKMLLYEKGAMFKSHTDTEKIPGMFGSLAICLPSEHQGGEVSLKHSGQHKLFKTSEATQSFACWYSDVHHEVLPVTSGYRWVVTYNLAIDHQEVRPSASLLTSETQTLRDAMSRWLSEDANSRENKFVYHVLDHDYTEANISLNALKAQDLARVQVLKTLRNEFPVEIFLGLLEKEEMGPCENDYSDWSSHRGRGRYGGYGGYGRYGGYDDEDEDDEEDEGGFHSLEEVFESTYTIKTVVDLEGHLVTEDLNFDEEDILEEDCFEGIDAEEEYEGYMGNYGPSATHWYRVTQQVRYFARECLRPQAPDVYFAELVKLCEQAWTEQSKTTSYTYRRLELSIDGEGMRDVLKVALQRKHYALFERIAVSHKGDLLLDFFTWLRQSLGTGDGGSEDQLIAIRKGLTSAVLSYHHFADQCRAIANLVPISDDSTPSAVGNPSSILVWARETIQSCLDDCTSKTFGKADGPAIVDLALYFEDPVAFLSEAVAPVINKKIAASSFVLGFLDRLRKQGIDGILPTERAMQLHRVVAKSFNTLTDFAKIHSDVGVQLTSMKREHPTTSNPSSWDEFRTAVTHQALVDHFSTMIQTSTDADDLVQPLISKIVADVSRFTSVELHVLWLPFLCSLVPVLTSNNLPLSTPCYQQLFRTVSTTYINKYVAREPTKDTNLVRREVSCSCRDCQELNAFLANPEQTVDRFPLNKKRRQHLHQGLDSARIDCTHTTLRQGSPQTLVVTKTFKHNAEARRVWASRRTQAVERFTSFPQDQLKLLLGQDYSKIVNMQELSAARRVLAPAATSRSAMNQANRALPRAGMKRKLSSAELEVIDLTSD